MIKLKIVIAILALASLNCISQDSLEVLNYYNSHYKKGEEVYREMGHGYDVHFRDSCLRGTKLAMADYEKGILRTGGFGLPAPQMFLEERVIKLNAFEKILNDEYGITYLHYGCVLGTYKDCYSYFMNEKIKDKYGDSLYQKVWKKVDSLWSNDIVDLPIRFPGGDSAFNKFIYCNLKLVAENDSKNKAHKMVILDLDLDKNGKIISYIIKGNYDPNHDSLNPVSSEYEKEIARLIGLMPNWLPKRVNNEFIPASKTIHIYFDKSRKDNINCN